MHARTTGKCLQAGALALSLALLSGCGSAPISQPSQLSSASSIGSYPGDVVFKIHWPERSRLLPLAATSIKITPSLPAATGGDPSMQIPPLTLPAPIIVPKDTPLAHFTNVPATDVTFTFAAYPNPDGTGVPQASARMVVRVKPNDAPNDPIGISLNTTIQTVKITTGKPVVSVGDKGQLVGTAYDQDGNVVITWGAKWVWKSTDLSTVFVSSTTPGAPESSDTASIIGNKSGMATITATESESGKSGTTVVAVSLLDHIDPTTASLSPGEAVSLTAKDKGGNPIPGSDLTWTSDNPSFTVSNIGNPATVTASQNASGPATIVVTQASSNLTAKILVNVAGIDHIDISPGSLSLNVKDTGLLTAIPRDKQGNTVSGSFVYTWSSDNPAVATVDPSSGVVTGVAPGGANITVKEAESSKSSGIPVAVHAPIAVGAIISGTIHFGANAKAPSVDYPFSIELKSGNIAMVTLNGQTGTPRYSGDNYGIDIFWDDIGDGYSAFNLSIFRDPTDLNKALINVHLGYIGPYDAVSGVRQVTGIDATISPPV